MYSIYDKQIRRLMSVGRNSATIRVNLDRVSRLCLPFNFRFAPKATVSDRSAACRDGPTGDMNQFSRGRIAQCHLRRLRLRQFLRGQDPG